jgi:hypothetical protein
MKRVAGIAAIPPMRMLLFLAMAFSLAAVASLTSVAPAGAQNVELHVEFARHFKTGPVPEAEFEFEIRDGIPPDMMRELRIDCIAGCKGAVPYREWVGLPFHSAVRRVGESAPVVTLWNDGAGFKVLVYLPHAEGITRVLEAGSVVPPRVTLGPNGQMWIEIQMHGTEGGDTSPVVIRHEWDRPSGRFHKHP